MARILYRLARGCAAKPWAVVLAWVVLSAVVAALAVFGSSRIVDRFDIPGTESDDAQIVLREHFGKAAPTTPGEGATRVLAVGDPSRDLVGQLDASVLSLVAEAGVESISPAAAGASPDGTAVFVDIEFTGDPQLTPDATRDAISAAADTARETGLQVYTTGGPFYAEASFVGISEVVGVAVAIVVLVVVFGSLVAAGVPLLIAGVGVVVGVGGVVVVSTLFDASSATLALALMLALAVGIDYSLFVLARHRDQLAEGLDVGDSIGRAVATSGSAVVFAGVTVVIALAGLSLAGIPFLTGMGLSAAACVLIAVFLTLTLTPAVAGLLGERLKPARAAATKKHRWVGAVVRRPAVTAVLGTAVLALIAVPASSMELGVPNVGQDRPGTEARDAYEALSMAYPEGLNGPFVVVIDSTGGGPLDDRAVAATHGAFAVDPGVALVDLPRKSDDGQAAQFYLIPSSGPSSRDTFDLVDELRSRAAVLESDYEIDIKLTGETVMAIDIGHKLAEKLPLFLIFIVGLSVLLLSVAFRSILVPLTAAVGFLLSLAATLGATTAVYQWGWLGGLFNVHRPAPLLAFLPIIVIGVLFGLAMDYQVFLVSRMREVWTRQHHPSKAIVDGYGASARVVLAAAVIMISVFSSFLFSHNTMVAPIGFALGVGIAFDALVVRLTMLPAVMTLMGKHAWSIPARLDSVLPRVDIEGESLDAVDRGSASQGGLVDSTTK